MFCSTYRAAVQLVPKRPGVYAFYGDDHAWTNLELTPGHKGQPLCIGTAEKSLAGRDVRAHSALAGQPRNGQEPVEVPHAEALRTGLAEVLVRMSPWLLAARTG